MRLVLASSSPRRSEVLSRLGLQFDTVAPDVDESRFPDEAAAQYVERVARAKAQVVAGPEILVVAADTAVVVEGRVLGKPGHPEEARAMLRKLGGGWHQVVTGLAAAANGEMHSLVDTTGVEMAPMTEGEISAYVDGGEPMDKAGAYALQGEGGVFVTAVQGSPSSVIGLPVHLLPRLLARFGAELGDFRSR